MPGAACCDEVWERAYARFETPAEEIAKFRTRAHRLGIDQWPHCPPIDGIQLSVPDPDGGKAIGWTGRLHEPARSVDQRLKMPAWLAEVERLGGKVVYHDATPADL